MMLCCVGRKSITGSFVGSVKETEEMLEFWKEKGLTSMIEIVTMDYINKAFERLEKNDVRYRFVVDVKGSKFEEWKCNTKQNTYNTVKSVDKLIIFLLCLYNWGFSLFSMLWFHTIQWCQFFMKAMVTKNSYFAIENVDFVVWI